MALPKVLGIETEYAVSCRNPDVNPMAASTILVNAFGHNASAVRAWDFVGETPGVDARDVWDASAEYPRVESMMANVILVNGARYYVDHAHSEVSSPECSSPSQVVLYDRAGDAVIRESMERVLRDLGPSMEITTHKNNSDGKGNSYGCHENYLVDRRVPFSSFQKFMTTHLVTRQVFAGAGKVGVEMARTGETRVAFQLSQRADFFEEEVGLETTIRRPIINTRDEPHADPVKYRRLHVITGDANMSEFATWLKVGTSALVLSCIEDGGIPDALSIVDPVTSIRLISHDVSLMSRVELVDGTSLTALDVQQRLAESVATWLDTVDDDTVEGEGRTILAEWVRVLDSLRHDQDSVADIVDWVAKRRLCEGIARRSQAGWDDPRVKLVDIQYHDLRPDKCLASRAQLRRMVSDDDIANAVQRPPATTRAFFRGTCMARWPGDIISANWDGIIARSGAGPVRIPMNEPLKGTELLVGQLLQRVVSMDELLRELGDVVLPMDEDPGW